MEALYPLKSSIMVSGPKIDRLSEMQAAASHDFDDAVHNVLRKCLQMDLIAHLNSPENGIEQTSNVNGYMLRGSSALLVAPEDMRIPRNPRDLDLVTLGTPNYEFEKASNHVCGHLHDACKAVGARVDFYPVEENAVESTRGWVGKHVVMPIVVGRRMYGHKLHGYATKDYTASDIDHIIAHPGDYHLVPRERELLEQKARSIAHNDVTLEIDLNMGLPHHQIPPVKPRNERRHQPNGNYQGVFLNDRIPDLNEKLDTLNKRWDKVSTDPAVAMQMVSAYNIYHRRFGGQMDSNFVEQMHQDGFRRSADIDQRRYHYLARNDIRGAMGGIPRNLTHPLSEQQIDQLQAIYDHAYDTFLLNKKVSREEIRDMAKVAVQLSSAIMLPNRINGNGSQHGGIA